MSGILPNIFGRNTDRQMAKDAATEIARIIGGKRGTNSRYVIGEPFCPYKVSAHSADFWCTTFVSDTSYVFRANHKLPSKEICSLVDLDVHLKSKPTSKLHPKKHLAKLSAELGVDIYTDVDDDEVFIAKILLSAPIRKILRGVDFYPVLEFYACPLHLVVTASMQSPAHCAEQVQLFHALIIAIFENAKARAFSI